MRLFLMYINVSATLMTRLMMAFVVFLYHVMVVLFDDVVIVLMRRLHGHTSTIYFYSRTCESAAWCESKNTKSNYRKDFHFTLLFYESTELTITDARRFLARANCISQADQNG